MSRADTSTAKRAHAARAAAPGLVLTLAIVVLFAASPARAGGPPNDATNVDPTPRPWAGRPGDAPNVDAAARIPPVPPEYHEENQTWIRFAYHPAARERVRPLFSRAHAIRAELRAILGDGVLQSVDVRVAAHPGELARLAPVELPGYVSSASFGQLHLVVMSLASPLTLEPPDLEDAFRHALAHLALDEAGGAGSLPRWFHEGFAVHASDEDAAARAQTLAVASLRGLLVGLGELDAHLPTDAPQSSIAYAQAADVVRFLVATERRDRFTDLLERTKRGEPWDQALSSAYGARPSEVEAAWRKEVARRYSFLPVLLSGSLLWLAVAAVAIIRRIRAHRVRRPLLVRRARIVDDPRPSRAPVMTPIRVVALRRREQSRNDGQHPDDVPKVEHAGRWYTLH